MPGCGKCGKRLNIVANQVGRRDECPHCGTELRACIHCRHYEPSVAKECKEPFAEVPNDKESANFCELYQIGDGAERAGQAKSELLSAAEQLFAKK